MGKKVGGMLEGDAVEGNRVGASDGVPYRLVCAEIAHNVLL